MRFREQLPARRALAVQSWAVFVMLVAGFAGAGQLTTFAESHLYADDIVHAETTPYQQYLAWLYEQYPVIDKKGVVDAQGNYLSYNTLTETQAGTISDYRDVLYNNIFDTKERDPSLYTIGEADE